MRRFFTFLLIGFSVASTQKLAGQGDLGSAVTFLQSEIELSIFLTPGKSNKGLALVRTEKEVELCVLTSIGLYPKFIYKAPKEVKIQSAAFKSNDYTKFFILLANGAVVEVEFDNQGDWNVTKTIAPTASISNAKTIVGDALYVLKSGKVYVSRDTAKTWSLDTLAINGESVQDVAVDSSNYAWIVTQSRNLYYQHADSNVWHKQPSYVTGGSPTSIFIDRRGRMFISSSPFATWVSYSTNGGASWTAVTDGLTQAVNKFGDDAFGNIYALGNVSQAFRLSDLTSPWVSVGDSIAAQEYIPSNTKIINAISGDTLLFAATRYGTFQSTDFGANWVHTTDVGQLHSHVFYAGMQRAGNYNFISNNLGIYRNTAGDSTWQKVYPEQGYIYGVNVLATDSAGNVYTNAPRKTGPSSYLFHILKSTDYGMSWALDTTGYGSVGITSGTQQFDFWVDRQGTEYLGGNGKLLSKRIGQPWKFDTTGIGILSGQYMKPVTLNNSKGIVYVCRNVPKVPSGVGLIIYSRTVSDSVWHVVNTTIPGDGDGNILSDHQGNLILKSIVPPYNIWRYDGTNWTQTPLPTGLGSIFTQNLVVDKNGVLWGTFFAGGNTGVYFTANNGASWNYVGLSGYGINFLTAADDTVYAVTAIDGIYKFTTSSTPTTVQNISQTVPSDFALSQNYPNPFNPTTNFEFRIANSELVRLSVYDVLGRRVATLVDEHKQAGAYRVTFDASRFSSGLYIYKLEAGRFTASRKMLLMK